MKNEKVQAVLDLVQAMATLLGVCCAILLSIEFLFDMDIFSIKRVIALAVLCESTYALKSVV